MPAWAVGLALLFAALPSPSFSFFDGLPIDRPVEFLLVALLVPLIASREAAASAAGAAGARMISAAAAAGIALKILLVVFGNPAGFIACVHGGTPPAAGAGCDRSFDNPFDRLGATRVDPRIQFDGATWRLGLLNSLRFDALRRDDAYVPPVPFSVEWTSMASAGTAHTLRVRYRGEATIRVDETIVTFPADYSASGADREVTIPAGRHRVVTSYRFAPPEVPYAPSSIMLARMDLEAPSAITWGTGRLESAGAWAIDLSGLIVAGVLVAGIVRRAPRDAVAAAALIAVALLVAAAPIAAYWRDKILEAAIVGGCLWWAWTGRRVAPLAGATLAVLCVLRVWGGTGPAPGVADYRLQGNDGLTYESFAHDILEQRSPRGGEDVFSLQILYRYIRFAERLVFGEADWLLLAGVLVAMNASYVWLARRVRLVTSSHGVLLLLLTGSMLWILNSASGSIEAPMSEYPTWLLTPLIVGLLFLGQRRRAWLAGAFLIGVASLTRFNQFPAYALLLLVFALAPPALAARPTRTDVAWCVAIAGLMTFGLPIAHNYWYGHSLTLLPTNRYSRLVVDLRPGDFLSDAQGPVWKLVWWKLSHLAHAGAESALTWFVPLHVLQAGIAIVAAGVLMKRVRVRAGHGWLMAAPAAALGVHLFYVVHFYYPRHIIFGYLLGGVVAQVWLAEDAVLRGRRRGVDLA